MQEPIRLLTNRARYHVQGARFPSCPSTRKLLMQTPRRKLAGIQPITLSTLYNETVGIKTMGQGEISLPLKPQINC